MAPKKSADPVKRQIETNDFGVSAIDNDALTAADVPPADADLRVIWHFALTFDAYHFWGSLERCAEIANARRHRSLTELRTCLFFEQRRWRHFSETPDKKAMAYIRKIVEQIRHRVAAGDLA